MKRLITGKYWVTLIFLTMTNYAWGELTYNPTQRLVLNKKESRTFMLQEKKDKKESICPKGKVLFDLIKIPPNLSSGQKKLMCQRGLSVIIAGADQVSKNIDPASCEFKGTEKTKDGYEKCLFCCKPKEPEKNQNLNENLNDVSCLY
ncbi:MAG: hypothetical protein NZT61_03910 [Deltaproteobacteria bacterium]|nr:hypothetical protein [Deltaproteobacteria bacterium]